LWKNNIITIDIVVTAILKLKNGFHVETRVACHFDKCSTIASSDVDKTNKFYARIFIFLFYIYFLTIISLGRVEYYCYMFTLLCVHVNTICNVFYILPCILNASSTLEYTFFFPVKKNCTILILLRQTPMAIVKKVKRVQ
jgi:hypothetical protein